MKFVNRKVLKGLVYVGFWKGQVRLTARVEIIKKIGMNCNHHKIYDPI